MNISSKMYSSLKTMKKLAVCVVLVFLCASVQAQSKDFKKLSKIDGVEHTHINKFQMKKRKQCTLVIFAEEEKEASLVIIKGELDIAKLKDDVKGILENPLSKM